MIDIIKEVIDIFTEKTGKPPISITISPRSYYKFSKALGMLCTSERGDLTTFLGITVNENIWLPVDMLVISNESHFGIYQEGQLSIHEALEKLASPTITMEND